jgi:hypothetical protein
MILWEAFLCCGVLMGLPGNHALTNLARLVNVEVIQNRK